MQFVCYPDPHSNAKWLLVVRVECAAHLVVGRVKTRHVYTQIAFSCICREKQNSPRVKEYCVGNRNNSSSPSHPYTDQFGPVTALAIATLKVPYCVPVLSGVFRKWSPVKVPPSGNLGSAGSRESMYVQNTCIIICRNTGK